MIKCLIALLFCLGPLAILKAQSVVWTIQSYPEIEFNTFFDIEFNSDLKGIVVGLNGEVLYSSNGGVDWRIGDKVNIARKLYTVKHLTGDVWYAGGTGLWKTTDNGVAWTSLSQTNIKDIFFLDSLNGLIVTDDTVLLTDDGCSTFKVVTPPHGHGWSAGAIAEPGLIFLTSISDTVAVSTNDGTTWNYQVPRVDYFRDCAIVQNFRLVGLGFDVAAKGGVVLVSDDFGKTWKTTAFDGNRFEFSKVDFVNERVGFIAGTSGVILRTDDAGTTWNPVRPPFETKSISAVNADTVFAINLTQIARTNGAWATDVAIESDLDQRIVLGPNPCNDVLVVTSSNSLRELHSVSMSSLLGEVVSTKACHGPTTSMDVSTLLSGTYLLTVTLADSTYSKIIQVQH